MRSAQSPMITLPPCLQEYLSDVTQVDIVYTAVLNRASGEPLRSVCRAHSASRVCNNLLVFSVMGCWA